MFSLENKAPWGDRDQLQNQFRNQGMMQLFVSKFRKAGVIVWEAKNKLPEVSALPSFVWFKMCPWGKFVFK